MTNEGQRLRAPNNPIQVDSNMYDIQVYFVSVQSIERPIKLIEEEEKKNRFVWITCVNSITKYACICSQYEGLFVYFELFTNQPIRNLIGLSE